MRKWEIPDMSSIQYSVSEILSLERRPVSIDTSGTYREIGIRSFGRGTFHKEETNGFRIGSKKVYRIKEGDLIFSSVFAWEGAVALANSTDDGLVGSHRFMTYRVDELKSDSRYLRHFFASGPGREAIKCASPGSAGRNRTLGIKSFAAQTIKLPHLKEQQRIANKLDALLGRFEAAQELRTRFSSILSTLSESLLANAIRSTQAVRIGDVLTLNRTPIIINPHEHYKSIGIRSFGKGLIHHPAKLGSNLGKLGYFRFDADALALSNLMAWEGGISVTKPEDSDYIASNRFFFYYPIQDRVNVSFLRYFLLGRRGQALISSACSSGAERNRTLGRQRFEDLKIPLPPRDEQDRVARILDSLAERTHRVQTNPALTALRPAILHAAFTGQL